MPHRVPVQEQVPGAFVRGGQEGQGGPLTGPILYLHGFASSARSTKAGYFAERLQDHGVVLGCPDFNEPEFATMTMTRMLGQLEQAMAGIGKPVTLIGSSLGGTLAVIAASRFGAKDQKYRRIGLPVKVEDSPGVTVARLVLLAPAVMFAKPGHHLLPAERVETWRERGALPFYHHGYSEERLLDFSFYEDSLTHDAFHALFDQPTLIFQGTRDNSVDYHTVETFANNRPNVALTLLDDDHQLIASLPKIWQEVEAFLGLRETRARGTAGEGCVE